MTALKMYKQRAAANSQGTPSTMVTVHPLQQEKQQEQQNSAPLAPSNPLFALVDAATSLLDKKDQHRARPSTPTTTINTSNSSTSTTSSVPSPTSVARDVPAFLAPDKEQHQQSFAMSLMSMLLDEQYSKIVTFLPDGNSWGIIHAKKFSDEVMPKVFGIRTFSSFVRKLTRWGFERVMEKKTHEVDVFRHDLFRKGDWTSCAKIRCGGARQHQGRPSELLAKAVAVTQSRAALALSQRQQQQQQILSIQRRLGLPLMSSAASLYQERRPSDPTAMLRSSAVATATAAHLAGAAGVVRRPSDPTRSHGACSLSDVTSQVVGEALATLRRDPDIAAVQRQQQQQQQRSLVQQQLLQDEMRKLEAQQQRVALLTSQLSSRRESLSPRSSLGLGYYGL